MRNPPLPDRPRRPNRSARSATRPTDTDARADVLSAEHSRHILPGVIGDDSAWDRADHEPGPVLFGVERRPRAPDNGWTVF